MPCAIPPTTTELSDGKVLLRPWREADASDLFEAARESIDSVGRWLPWCHAGYAYAEAVDWISRSQRAWIDGDYFALPAFDATNGRLLGAVGINQLDRRNHRANLGYWIRQARQGQGIAARAVLLAARFAFGQLDLGRLEIVAMPQNHASRRTADKVGARFEGMARHRLWGEAGPCDAAVYALLPGDLIQASAAQNRAMSS